MRGRERSTEYETFPKFNPSEILILSSEEERSMLRELATCKSKLTQAMRAFPEGESGLEPENPQVLAQTIATTYLGNGPADARLGAVFLQYSRLRVKLAMANTKLVAHVAKMFRDRGIPYLDLIQEGFCGLLEAIDRFDVEQHETKLATYATWWIRQAMQQAVASGAYPVRLTPRHLRQLAKSQNDSTASAADVTNPKGEDYEAFPMTEMLQRIQSATRPTISLSASLANDSRFMNSRDQGSEGVVEPAAELGVGEAVQSLVGHLTPRELQVVSLRFGLNGGEQHSLSQAGKVLGVSKERVRQIQDRALQKLRLAADRDKLESRLVITS